MKRKKNGEPAINLVRQPRHCAAQRTCAQRARRKPRKQRHAAQQDACCAASACKISIIRGFTTRPRCEKPVSDGRTARAPGALSARPDRQEHGENKPGAVQRSKRNMRHKAAKKRKCLELPKTRQESKRQNVAGGPVSRHSPCHNRPCHNKPCHNKTMPRPVKRPKNKGCRMSTQSFREDRFVSFHDSPAAESTAAAKGLLIGLAVSQVFWIGFALLVF